MTDLVENLNALITQRERNALEQLKSRGGLAGQTGLGSFTDPDSGKSGGKGGIASPLTEVTKDGESIRTYHKDVVSLYSSDMLLSVEIQPLKTLTMLDANKEKVVLEFAKPKAAT